MMIMQKKTLFFSLILLIGASLSICLMLIRDHKITENKTPNGVNAFMTNPFYKDYNKKGQIHSQLQATRMQHYFGQDTSIFTNPKILIYTDERIPWHITSEYGRSQQGTQKVFLYENVKLFQPQLPNHPKTTILTSELTIYPNRSFAKSDKKVKIKQPGTVVNGKGITADFKTSIFTLVSNSRGIYQPTAKNQS